MSRVVSELPVPPRRIRETYVGGAKDIRTTNTPFRAIPNDLRPFSAAKDYVHSEMGLARLDPVG
jgi:hypothetical protein